MMFKYFSGIDVHDHLRQGVFNLEDSWRTQAWKTRAFASLTAMSMTDAYLSWCHELQGNARPPGFAAFLGRLAHQLIHNPWLPSALNRQMQLRSVVSPPPVPLQPRERHQLGLLTDIPHQSDNRLQPREGRAHDVRLRCKICHQSTTYYCKECSVVNNRSYDFAQLYAVCAPGDRRKRKRSGDGEFLPAVTVQKLCYKQHLDNCVEQ
jgi:hypothetical protein